EPPRRNTKRMNPPILLAFSTRLRLEIHTSDRYCTSWKTSNNAMPTRMFETRLLQYHQKAMLVISKATFTGLGRWPPTHCRVKCSKKRTETASAAKRINCWPLCRSEGGINGPPHM